LFDHIRLGQWEDVSYYALDLIQVYENGGADLLQIQQRVLELMWVISRVMSEVGVETDTPLYSFQAQDCRQLRSETSYLLDRMKESYTKHYGKLEADAIQQIKVYISEHSNEDISLDVLGQRV